MTTLKYLSTLSFYFSLLLQNLESNNNDIKWRNTPPPLSRSKTLPDLLCQEQDGCIPIFNKGDLLFFLNKLIENI